MPGKKKEIRLGCLWGILLPLAYTVLFIIVLLLIPHEPIPENLAWHEYLGVIFKLGVYGVVALVLYFVLLVPVIVIGIMLGLKDPSVVKTLKVSWPFLLALVYIIMPDVLPGPVDDVVVTFIASSIGALLLGRQLRKRAEPGGELDRGAVEIEVLDVEEKSTAIEKPREIIEADFEEKE